MEKGINFLKTRRITIEEKKKVLFWRGISVFLLVFYCLALVAIFSFGLVTRHEVELLRQRVKKEEKKLLQLRKNELLYLLLKERVSLLKKMVPQQGVDPKESLVAFQSLLSEGVSLEEVVWEEEGGEMTIVGEAADGLILANFLDRLTTAVKEGRFKKVVLSSASRETSPSYDFSLIIKLKEEKK